MEGQGKWERLLIWIVLFGLTTVVACQTEPTEWELKQTPFGTYSDMLAINVTAYRLTSPTIDSVTWLNEGRVSTIVSGDSRLKLLASDRQELFVLDFETVYVTTGSDTLRDAVLLTFIVPYRSDVYSIRLETPQGSDEVLLAEMVDVLGGE